MAISTRSKFGGGLAGLAGLAWAGLTAYIVTNQRNLVFNPAVGHDIESPRSGGHRTRTVVLRASDGTRLVGWLMTPQDAAVHHPAVLYFGGRSEEVSWVARDAGRLFPGMTVLAVNYRGYGHSQGFPGEESLVNDARVLYDWLARRGRVDATRIAVVGRSLGSGVAVQVALARPARAVVLITPYDSILALAKRRFFRAIPMDIVLKHRFESVKYAPSLTTPTYVLRAASDDVVPHSHTDLLVTKLANLHADETIPGSNHGDIPYLPVTQDKIALFLRVNFDEKVAA